MTKLNSVCVFCGSRNGRDPAYVSEAEILGRDLARAGVTLVFGGASIGIMGTVARATLAGGGKVLGVIPGFLKEIEVPLDGVNERILTKTMHERKKIMFDRSDAFVIMPGGTGTLDETFEVMTWRQLHQHAKPIIIADINGYWQPFLALVRHCVDSGFAGRDVLSMLTVVKSAADILPAIEGALASRVDGQAAHLEQI